MVMSAGKVNPKCVPFCNHLPPDAYSFSVNMLARDGVSAYERNWGRAGMPCGGPGKLSCNYADRIKCWPSTDAKTKRTLPYFNTEEFGLCDTAPTSWTAPLPTPAPTLPPSNNPTSWTPTSSSPTPPTKQPTGLPTTASKAPVPS
jgi:hypothetical protein